MDQIFTAITTAANALAKMVNATHVFVISDMPCNEVPFDVPTTFITTSTLANGVNDELRDFLREGGTRTFNASIVAPVLNDFSLVKDVATAAYIDDIVDGGFVLGVLCLSQLSSIVVFDVKQLATVKTIDKTGERVDPTALKAVLRLALELGREGREGKKVGTAFIIGDTNEVLKRSHQLILNPYKGHSEDTRDIKNRSHWETIKEFAQIDGVFIVNDKGVIISAGRYLDVNTKSIELGGFGGRHISALAVTRETQAIAVTVSESGGTVRLFKDGIETKIESSADLLMLLL
ncbi:MAG: DNA integrity scanning protein DisA nucleotide-binding domain protein [Halobacteriota archaeon]